ncbi:MAG: class I SAM-dependent methyltransferase, partial [Candidatus Geothermincolia bacterium]
MARLSSYEPRGYWQARLDKDFSLSGVGFLGLGNAFNTWAYKARRRVLLDTIGSTSTRIDGRDVLEIGPGTGFYLDVWRDLGASSVTGVDITGRSVVELSRRYPRFDFREMDIGEPGMDLSKKFDVITAFDVLHHIVDETRFENALENIARHASPDATILIMDFFSGREFSDSFSHQKVRTIDDYRRRLDRLSLKITTCRPVFTLFNAPYDLS